MSDWVAEKRKELWRGGCDTQKFHRGDLVKLSEKSLKEHQYLGISSLGVIVGSYDDECNHSDWWKEDGDGNPHPKGWKCGKQEYTIAFEHNTVSWFKEDDLTLVGLGQPPR